MALRVSIRRLLGLGPKACRRGSRIDGRTSSFPPQSTWQSPRSSRQSTLCRVVCVIASVPSPVSYASLHLTSMATTVLFPSRSGQQRFEGRFLKRRNFGGDSCLNSIFGGLLLERIVLSPRKRPVNQVGLDGSRTITLWHEKIGDVPPGVRSASAQQKFSTLSPEELLGPLNDVERTFAPREIFAAGPMVIPLPRPRVAIVGSRKASTTGLGVAADITKTLCKKGVVIVSGLAEGIDTVAHRTTIEERGRTIGVIGTALDRVYPRENSKLQEEMMANHLVISQFPIGYPTRPENFVMRNRTMALIANASIIVEAGEKSGSLHQGWEALRLGRPLFIWKSVVNNSSLSWPKKMMGYGALELDDPGQVVEVLPSSERIIKIAV